MAKRPPVVPNRLSARAILDQTWSEILANDDSNAPPEIHSLVNSEQVSVRFCLPTQLLGKLTDFSLDALSLQRGDGSDGKWDPRGFASAVIVPWNRENQAVLGASGDPYVSNPLRRPRLDSGLEQMADPAEWVRLCEILRPVQDAGNAKLANQKLREVLIAVRDRLRDLSFTYVVPPRVSLNQTLKLVADFLSEKSGGDRGLALSAALFESFKDHFGIYSRIRRGVINATDAASGSVADLECIGSDGSSIVLAVEVKERRIGEADVHSAIAKARAFSVKELLLCIDGINQGEMDGVAKSITSAWASGTNVYYVTLTDLIRSALPLLGEAGIRSFVVNVGLQLDLFKTQPKHRKAWKSLLDQL